ncbi:MAG: hypothetical protein WAV23_00505 [Minisyncoccia bacterium]
MKLRPQAHEKILRGIYANNGTKLDLKMYFDEKMARRVGKEIAEFSKKISLSNPIFRVYPVNDIQGNLDKFDTQCHPSLKKEGVKFSLESKNIPAYIELIKCKPTEEYQSILKEIKERSFFPAPSPYVYGLGIQHKNIIEESFGCIFSPDKKIYLKTSTVIRVLWVLILATTTKPL